MGAYSILIGAVVVGLVAGLLGTRFLAAAFGVTALATITYLSFVAWFGIRAAQCWECTDGYESTRGFVFFLVIAAYGVFAVAIIASTWAVVGLSRLLRRAGRA